MRTPFLRRAALGLGLLALATGLALWFGLPLLERRAEPLPTLAQVQPFALTGHQGGTFDSHQLSGKVWVANFIFTRCPSICLAFSSKMADIQRLTAQHGDAFQLLSFSVDPEHDTAEVLARYAQKYGATERWTFLTGARDALRTVVVSSLKVHMEEGPKADLMSVAHGSHFVLVDGSGHIRGYYRLEDADTAEAVARDAARLLSELSASP